VVNRGSELAVDAVLGIVLPKFHRHEFPPW
jgi:hypothetical protein